MKERDHVELSETVYMRRAAVTFGGNGRSLLADCALDCLGVGSWQPYSYPAQVRSAPPKCSTPCPQESFYASGEQSDCSPPLRRSVERPQSGGCGHVAFAKPCTAG